MDLHGGVAVPCMQVSKTEFMMFMLEELDLADPDEMQTILRMFAAVDRNNDGVLNVADVRRRLHTEHDTAQPQQD